VVEDGSGPARDIMFFFGTSELPMSSGLQLVDELPVIVVADLADRGSRSRRTTSVRTARHRRR